MRASLEMVPGRHSREGEEPQSVSATREESDALVLPEKPANAVVTPAESVEERAAANGNSPSETHSGHGAGIRARTNLERVGEKARSDKRERFVNLLSHIKAPLLKEAYLSLRKDAATGVDGETWSAYGEDLDARLLDLQDRVHRGSYHPLPTRRVHIPKPDGRTRPLGIPSLEDKIVQQAVRKVLEPIYEEMFIGASYGFRPGRSPHHALDALFVALNRKTNWVLDADIRSFFDTIDHGWMQQFIEHRIGDKRLVRLLLKWLHAGVLDEGVLQATNRGTPQGGIISPLLANIYLHYALDLWVMKWRERRDRGEVYFVRYADDFVMCFEHERDARQMREQLDLRLTKFGLELHPDKTRVMRFGRFARRDSAQDGRQRPETFEFLGFTHICAAGQGGCFRVARRTSRKKRNAKLRQLSDEIPRRRHWPVIEQYRWLASVLRGHYAYYGVTGNYQALKSFRTRIRRCWHRALQRRSQRARWTRRTLDAFDAHFALPPPRITRPHPFERFPLR